MAGTAKTVTPYPELNLLRVNWLLIPVSTVGDPDTLHQDFADRCVQVTGTFGAGGSVTIQGSNDDGTTWSTLKDAFGTALTFTSAGIAQITELPQYIRPSVTAGDGTTAINVRIFMRGVRQ